MKTYFMDGQRALMLVIKPDSAPMWKDVEPFQMLKNQSAVFIRESEWPVIEKELREAGLLTAHKEQ